MYKIKLIICILLLEVIGLFACTSSKASETLPTQNADAYCEMYNSSIDTSNVKTLEEEKFYKIVLSDSVYCYWIYDEKHNIVKSGGPLNREPHISMVNAHLVKFTLQAGTQWGYYYNAEKDVLSRNFVSILDQSDDKVIYCETGKIVIRDIFDKTKYYHEISDFKEEFSEVAFPFIDAKFVNGGKSVKITYLSGSTFEKVTEEIESP